MKKLDVQAEFYYNVIKFTTKEVITLKKYKIIDAHCHIYPDKIAEKAAKSTGSFYGVEMCYDGKVSTLLEAGDRAGVDYYIVQSVATKPEQVSSINRFIAESVAEYGDKMTGLGTLHPDSEDMERDVEELISLGLKGVKLHPDIQGFKLDDYRCLKIYELCEGRLPILFHTGDSRYDMSNPNRMMPILEIYDNLTAICAHFGGYSVWDDAEKHLPKYPNAFVDCSSSFFKMTDDEIKKAIDAYGVDRVMFGTDYPMWEPQAEIERLLSLGLSREDYEKIFHKNAERIFGIEGI